MHRQIRIAAPFLLLLALVLPAEAGATPIRFDFSGTLSSVLDNNNHLPAAIQSGDVFTGRFVYDDGLSITDFGSGLGGRNNGFFFVIDIFSSDKKRRFVDIGVNASGLGASLQMQNNHASFQDRFAINGFNTIYPADVPDGTAGCSPLPCNISQIQLQDTTSAVFSSLTLPTTLNFADFDVRTINLSATFGGSDIYSIKGSITALSGPTVVPQPATALPVMLGLAGMSFMGRRRGTKRGGRGPEAR